MRLKQQRHDNSAAAGFTLAEVLAALMFLAIVIPVAVQALRVASLAGEVAERKGQAARIAERVLSENIVTTNYTMPSLTGTIYEGTRDFRWSMRSEPWTQNTTNNVNGTSMGQLPGGQPMVNQASASQVLMNLLTVEVSYTIQDKDYSVRLATLVNSQ